MGNPVLQRAFSAGELAPAFHARADAAQYVTGLRTCKNFFVRKEGGVSNRAGFKYLASAKVMSGLVKLYAWVFTAADQSTLIEAGDLYFRFYKQGVPVTVAIASLPAWSGATAYVIGDLVQSGGVAYYCILGHTNFVPPNATYWYALTTSGANAIYELPTPYAAGAFDSPGPLRFAQQGLAITITHTAYQPRELRNVDPLGATPRWTLTPIVTAPTIATPAGLTGAPGAAGTLTRRYKVTAIDAVSGEESLPTAAFDVTLTDVPTELAPIPLSWTAVAGASEYRVYLDASGNNTFGYIGTATGQVTFDDTGFAPDESFTPPIARSLFTTPLDYPEVSASYQQRRCFGYTDNQPATVWASRTGLPLNFCTRSPLQDDDAVTFTHASNDMNVVRHLIPLKRLVMLTESGEWVVRGDADGVLKPEAINLDQEGYAGASRAFPAVVANSVLYVQARGSIVRDLVFTDDTALLRTRDLTLYAAHLFERLEVGRLAFQQAPHSITWATRNDGVLLGLTYLPEQELWGWHRHTTQAAGAFEDICVVPEGDEDVLYAVVRRTINGSTVRYIERMASRSIDEATFAEDCFFVDAGITYNGAPTTTITGLTHLNGEVVAVVADGVAVFNGDPDGSEAALYTVAGGQITIPQAASIVHVGLAIQWPDIETLDLDVAGSAVRDQRKVITSLSLLIDKSSQGFQAGPDEASLITQTVDPWEVPAARVSKKVEIALTSAWSDHGRTLIRMKQPLPLTVLAVIPNVTLGG